MKVVIVGAGGIGQHIAVQAANAGHDVVLASRSGSGLTDALAAPLGALRTARVDASDASALTALAADAGVIVNAVNPPYTRWPELWPPLAAAFLGAAEHSGAGLLTVGNLYGYGVPDAPLTEGSPVRPNGVKGRVRAQMWADALAAHQAGRVHATEIRASDYFGPGAGAEVSQLNRFVLDPALAGKTPWQLTGDVRSPHAWTYLPDIAALAVALIGVDHGGDAWGRPWLVPTEPGRSMTQAVADASQITGTPLRSPRPLPGFVRAAAHLMPIVRELDEMAPTFATPYEVDTRAAQERFGLAATPWTQALTETITWMRGR